MNVSPDVRPEERTDPRSDRVDETVAAAACAATVLAATSRGDRARLLCAMADALDEQAVPLSRLAARESHLDEDVLRAEVQRTTAQLRMFADVLHDGGYLELAVAESGRPARAVRHLVPLGPVAVFGSSNFPFAYGAAGGDAASALAAGCAIVVKVHPGHPETCRAVVEIMRGASIARGLPADVVTMVAGFEAGVALVRADPIAGVGFTGSTAGGRALFDLCAGRPRPIPFYGELGSLNPVVVTAEAAADRGEQIGDLLAGSMLTRHGQVCTKPGIMLVPRGPAGDGVVAALVAGVADRPARLLLGDAVRRQFQAGVDDLAAREVVEILAGRAPDAGREAVGPVVLGVADPAAVSTLGLGEIFGPVTVVVRYDGAEQAVGVLKVLEPALVGGLHGVDEDADGARLLTALAPLVGRVVWNLPTTGLAVDWATTHSGPYPATTSVHSSVGASAIRRWLMPQSYEGVPQALLPAGLADDELALLPHRRDAELRLP